MYHEAKKIFSLNITTYDEGSGSGYDGDGIDDDGNGSQ